MGNTKNKQANKERNELLEMIFESKQLRCDCHRPAPRACSPRIASHVQKVSWGQWSYGWRDVLVSPVNKHPRSLVGDLLRLPHLPGQGPLPRPLHGETEGIKSSKLFDFVPFLI